jgi:hypothetical protein
MKKLLIVYVIFLLSSCNSEEKQFITDKDIIILEEKISFDKKHKIISYNFDLGAIGDSRVYWVILPDDFDKKEPLNDYIIPDGYKAINWNIKNEAILEKWTPNYYKDEEVVLKSGDELNDVIVEVK